MRVFDGIADVQSAVGTHLGYSDWHTVTQQQIDAFADATGELLAVKPVALGHQVRVRATIERDGGEKPVCVIDVLRVAAP